MSHNPFDNFVNSMNMDNLPPQETAQGPSEQDANHFPHGAELDALEASLSENPPRRSVAHVSSDEAALDAAAIFLGRLPTDEEARTILHALHNGGGQVTVNGDPEDEGDEDTLQIEPLAQPTMSELFSHAGDDPEMNEQFNDFMDTLPDPNSTSLWESKLDDLQLQLRGLVTNEVFNNFVDGHYPEWMPDAGRFATMEDYQRARKQAVVKIKYLISFAITLMSLSERELRRLQGLSRYD